MKISYNWLKQYIDLKLSPEETAALLTGCGLEVESIEKLETIKGGLEGLVIGEVKEKTKHPDADRLSVTKVDVGGAELLNIVCGAPNVDAGQKVVVAVVGTTVHPLTGEPFQIKKSKIRGALSEGMICAEDEIGLGTSHAGIMVLDSSAKVGTSAKEYFKVENDYIFEIGLTPNRSDAASHVGVARDLAAVINSQSIVNSPQSRVILPNIENFVVDNEIFKIEVIIEDVEVCPRYSGVTISGVEVKDSPEWLQTRLKSIGLKPINNIVDATNFVLHELGQPLHAFDAAHITGAKVIVKKLAQGTKFTTLDGIERELSSNDLMICNTEEGMCIAGVFGGLKSGITAETKNIFLESAYFNPVSIRKTSRLHGLKTDASFRFERGADPNITVYALKRAALLIKEIAGGKISSQVIDVYSEEIENFKIDFSYANAERLIGKALPREIIKNILHDLQIGIEKETETGLLLSVPPFKADVIREADVVEEILRVYGYNNIEIPTQVRSSLSYSVKPDVEKVKNTISDLLTAKGFTEIMCNSLTAEKYSELLDETEKAKTVRILNPLSSDLGVMRQTLLFSGLEAIAYNINRKNPDLKFYEFGKTYHLSDSGDWKYAEKSRLSVLVTGRKESEGWNSNRQNVNYFFLKGIIESVLNKLGLQAKEISSENNSSLHSYASGYELNKKVFAEFGEVNKQVLKKFDIEQEVLYADFDWDEILKQLKKVSLQYREVPVYPSVRRDLALLVDKAVRYSDIKELAFRTEKNLLKEVNLFDVYEGKNLEPGKKSYAVSFIIQDENATLNDKTINKVMEKMAATLKENLGAAIR
ncbi:MAG: Phenylalanine--tRNA ligase beta subunit [Bacteroidia bacterium]|nr:Phenylalanine--tRNA ligase beta subunit [Bacteroidia bacterium]